MILNITLPIPSSKLAINKSNGTFWAMTSPLKKKAKSDGFILARNYLQSQSPYILETDYLKCDILVYHKNGVHLDDDNLIGALKSYQDGAFEALKLFYPKINDKQIGIRVIDTRHKDKNNPRIEYRLSEILV